MRLTLSKPVITNITFLLLFTLFTSGFLWSFYLQKESHQTIDKFYRSTNWYANRTLYLSEKFLYQAHLYELKGIEFSELSKTYDLLWNRLQIFLESRSTEFLRNQHPEVTQDVQTLFNTIQSLEHFFDQQQDRPNQEFTDKVNQVKENLITLNYSLSKVLSGTISQGIRTHSDLIQYWQLTGFIITMILTLILFRLSRRSAKLAQIDPLTQLGNRRALTEHLRNLLNKNKSLTLCAIDIKRFKQFNDQIGYQVGDQVLIKFAQRLNQFKNSQAFRFGGDEFVLVIPNLEKQPSLINWVLELQQQLQFTYQFEDHQLPIAIRLGVTFTDKNQQTYLEAKQLLDQAIHALN
ncbi:GGDEF domain-containing protein [Vibrio aphrogenes]|uniref:GGDEF domain-containing protein n=1 Tax=Vibrio aphrogenes TaxID=1891186 RepID=UPI000B35DBD6|nr:GGDEF domain-containing protein [Vibrio aphrogenes]